MGVSALKHPVSQSGPSAFWAAAGWGMWHLGSGPPVPHGWLTALLVAWGGVIAATVLFSRQLPLQSVHRAAVVLLYVGALLLGWLSLRAHWPFMWPFGAVAAVAGATLAAGYLATRQPPKLLP